MSFAEIGRLRGGRRFGLVASGVREEIVSLFWS